MTFLCHPLSPVVVAGHRRLSSVRTGHPSFRGDATKTSRLEHQLLPVDVVASRVHRHFRKSIDAVANGTHARLRVVTLLWTSPQWKTLNGAHIMVLARRAFHFDDNRHEFRNIFLIKASRLDIKVRAPAAAAPNTPLGPGSLCSE